MTAKKIGANLAVVLGKERLAKKVTKEESASILKNVENYNKAVEAGRAEKTIAKWEKLVRAAMTINTTKKKEAKVEKKAAAKIIKKRVKKSVTKGKAKKEVKAESKLLKSIKSEAKPTQSAIKSGIAYLQSLLTKAKATPKPKATTGRKSSGEY